MTCVCTGISVRVGDYWHSCDVHTLKGGADVYVLRLNNSVSGHPLCGRQAIVDYECDLSCWFDRHRAVHSTLVVPRTALKMNDEARVYVEENITWQRVNEKLIGECVALLS